MKKAMAGKYKNKPYNAKKPADQLIHQITKEIETKNNGITQAQTMNPDTPDGL